MKIVVLAGDGIGPEITDVALEVMQAAAEKFNLKLEFDHKLMGGCAIDKFGVPLPEETLAAAKASDGVLLGAVGGPKWDKVDPGIRPEKGLLGIRKGLGLYCNLRPMVVSKYCAHLSPLKAERAEGADLLIVRELTGGIYFGEHKEAAMINGVETASDIELYTRPEIERIARKAFEAAKLRRGKVTSVDKANVLGSSRMWRKIVTQMQQQDYPELELNHMYVDNCAMQFILNPKQFDVVVTGNLFGDILSDEASMLTGSIGMLPSASMNSNKQGLYEPSHGSAPDIAGKNMANPLATMLSAAMMLRYSLDEAAQAERIEAAVQSVLKQGLRTADIYEEGTTRVSTSEMGDAVLKALK